MHAMTASASLATFCNGAHHPRKTLSSFAQSIHIYLAEATTAHSNGLTRRNGRLWSGGALNSLTPTESTSSTQAVRRPASTNDTTRRGMTRSRDRAPPRLSTAETPPLVFFTPAPRRPSYLAAARKRPRRHLDRLSTSGWNLSLFC
ncbi:hypothetical protein FKP32DRAFT_131553 [Trametes sanguinea]|nr:hypothetical protein FKP32DRAFT_131553 [Trametes sanguinea]